MSKTFRKRADAATMANVDSSASSVTLAAANAKRMGMVVHNDSSAILYIAYAATASTTVHTYEVAADGMWEMPSTLLYTGVISAIWASANGAARVTELVG